MHKDLSCTDRASSAGVLNWTQSKFPSTHSGFASGVGWATCESTCFDLIHGTALTAELMMSSRSRRNLLPSVNCIPSLLGKHNLVIFFFEGGLNIWRRNTATDTFHPLTASLDVEVLVLRRGGQSPAHLVRHMGCNSSGSTLVLSVAHHPLPLDSCSYRPSCYSAHALGNCPARWLRPNDVTSWTRGGTVA